MSMELCLLSDRRLSSITEWQNAIEAEGFPLILSQATPFDQLSGGLAAMLGDKRTGFECDHWDASEVITEAPEVEFGHPWRFALAFRWLGMDLEQGDAVLMAAAAYARATGGVILDYEGGRLLGPDDLKDILHESLRTRPLIEEAVRRIVESFKS
jgi:hypothetical protein